MSGCCSGGSNRDTKSNSASVDRFINQGRRGNSINQKPTELKICLLGESGVGKTSIAQYYVTKTFTTYASNIGASYLTKMHPTGNKLPNGEDEKIKLNIWDTAGQERFHSLSPIYIRAAHAIVLVYDLSKQSTFVGAKEWLERVNDQLESNAAILLVGSKADLPTRDVDRAVVEAYAQENKMGHMECSAKNGTGVAEVFDTVVKMALSNAPNSLQNY